MELGSGQAVDDEPHLILGLSMEFSGHGFGRVHLNGKVLLGVQNLQQQGKAFAFGAVAEDLLAVVGPKVIERAALEGSMVHHGLVFNAVHHLPGLADGAAIVRKCPLIAVFELSTTPYAFHVEGLECDGFHARTYEFHCWIWQGLSHQIGKSGH